jgi:hypothetical protein
MKEMMACSVKSMHNRIDMSKPLQDLTREHQPLVAGGVIVMRNVDRYLAEAVDSILLQSFQTFEFITFDFGSTDRSKEIAAEFAGRDHRTILSLPERFQCQVEFIFRDLMLIYYRFLANALSRRKGKELWKYHREQLSNFVIPSGPCV